MHQFIGRYATETVGLPDTDGDGVINLYDLCEWTETVYQPIQLDVHGTSKMRTKMEF